MLPDLPVTAGTSCQQAEVNAHDMLLQGQASDIDIHAKEILYLREKLYALYHKHTLRPMDEIGGLLQLCRC